MNVTSHWLLNGVHVADTLIEQRIVLNSHFFLYIWGWARMSR